MEASSFSSSSSSYSTVWNLICGMVPKAEIEEIRRALGDKLVDESEALKSEVEALREILGEYAETVAKESLRRSFRLKLSGAGSLPDSKSRSLLENHIYLLMSSLRIKRERADGAIIGPMNGRIETYVTAKVAGGGKRPSSRRGSSSQPSTARSSSSGLSSSSAPEVLQNVKGDLNAYEIDKVTLLLRDIVREENQGMVDEISRLQESLDMEHEEFVEQKKNQKEEEAPPPSMGELREYSTALEEHLYKEEEKENDEAKVAKDQRPSPSPLPPISSPQQQRMIKRTSAERLRHAVYESRS